MSLNIDTYLCHNINNNLYQKINTNLCYNINKY